MAFHSILSVQISKIKFIYTPHIVLKYPELRSVHKLSVHFVQTGGNKNMCKKKQNTVQDKNDFMNQNKITFKILKKTTQNNFTI